MPPAFTARSTAGRLPTDNARARKPRRAAAAGQQEPAAGHPPAARRARPYDLAARAGEPRAGSRRSPAIARAEDHELARVGAREHRVRALGGPVAAAAAACRARIRAGARRRRGGGTSPTARTLPANSSARHANRLGRVGGHDQRRAAVDGLAQESRRRSPGRPPGRRPPRRSRRSLRPSPRSGVPWRWGARDRQCGCSRAAPDTAPGVLTRSMVSTFTRHGPPSRTIDVQRTPVATATRSRRRRATASRAEARRRPRTPGPAWPGEPRCRGTGAAGGSSPASTLSTGTLARASPAGAVVVDRHGPNSGGVPPGTEGRTPPAHHRRGPRTDRRGACGLGAGGPTPNARWICAIRGGWCRPGWARRRQERS